MALTGCAGAGVATLAALFVCPPLLMVADIVSGAKPDDPPFLWLEPIQWLLPTFCLLGACAGVVVAWQGLRGGRLPNKPQEPASREQRNPESGSPRAARGQAHAAGDRG